MTAPDSSGPIGSVSTRAATCGDLVNADGQTDRDGANNVWTGTVGRGGKSDALRGCMGPAASRTPGALLRPIVTDPKVRHLVGVGPMVDRRSRWACGRQERQVGTSVPEIKA